MAEIGQACQVRQHEAIELRRAEQWPVLSAKVVADEEDVDRVRGGVENPPADRNVVVNDVPQHGIHDLGLIVELEVQRLHAEQVDRIVPERRPIAAENGVSAIPCQRVAADVRHVLPLRIGPGIVMDFAERGIGKRVAQRLAVAVPCTLDPEDRPVDGAGESGGCGPT